MPFILALDQGTTSSRAVLVNESGAIAAMGQCAFRQYFPLPGYVEHDATEIWESEVASIRETMEAAGARKGDVTAIGVTNQRETAVIWDRETGVPVCPAIVWQDRRTAEICERLEKSGVGGEIAEKTGLLIDPYFSATKIAWILDNVPGARTRAGLGELLFGTIETWLIWKLTGGAAHVTDYSNASRTMIFDTKNLCFDRDLCNFLGVPMNILPRPVGNSEIYGKVTRIPGLEALEGMPICGAAGDQPAALFGQTCFDAGEIKATYGTGCFVLANTGEERVLSENRLLSSVAFHIGGKTRYALEGSIFNAGSVIQWLRDELGIIETARECDTLAEEVPDSGGVYFVPALTGLGAPHWDMYARGALFGMTRGTGRAQICRATLEAIAFQLRDLLDVLRKDLPLPLNRLNVDGGASRSDILMEMTADLARVTVSRPTCIESTALGAAFLAGLACGFWPDLAALKKLRHEAASFAPAMDDAKRAAMLHGWEEAVRRSLGWGRE